MVHKHQESSPTRGCSSSAPAAAARLAASTATAAACSSLFDEVGPPYILVRKNIPGVFLSQQLLVYSHLPPWSVLTLVVYEATCSGHDYTNKPESSCGGGVKEGSRWNEILGTPLGAVLGAGLSETTCSPE